MVETKNQRMDGPIVLFARRLDFLIFAFNDTIIKSRRGQFVSIKVLNELVCVMLGLGG